MQHRKDLSVHFPLIVLHYFCCTILDVVLGRRQDFWESLQPPLDNTWRVGSSFDVTTIWYLFECLCSSFPISHGGLEFDLLALFLSWLPLSFRSRSIFFFFYFPFQSGWEFLCIMLFFKMFMMRSMQRIMIIYFISFTSAFIALICRGLF